MPRQAGSCRLSQTLGITNTTVSLRSRSSAVVNQLLKLLTLSRNRLAYRRENIAFFRAAVIRTTEQVLSAGSPSVCSSLLKSVNGAIGLGVALGEPHSVSAGSQTNGKSKSSIRQLGRFHTVSAATVQFEPLSHHHRFSGYI